MTDQILEEDKVNELIKEVLKAPRLVTAPNDILKVRCSPVNWSPEIDNVLDLMVAMMNAHKGIGLAAPQIGLPFQLLIAKTAKGIITAINPVLKEVSDNSVWIKEGCLSYPNYFVSLERPESVTVALEGENPEFPLEETFEDMDARIILHEMDHLDGICLADRILDLPKNKQRIARDKLSKQMRKMR